MAINIVLAVLLDFILGDPYSFPHPVKLMGNIINYEEKLARKLFKSRQGLKLAGLIIVTVNIFLGFSIPFFLLKLISPYKFLHRLISIYLIYTCLAARSLHYEAMKVYEAIGQGLKEARHRLSYIVGRETTNLSEEEIIKATVETVAENTSDGVIAPLLFIFLLGIPGGFLYKFINTMDSMLAYMNDKYIDLGYFTAKTDDIANYIPARLSGLLMIISSIFTHDIGSGMKIMLRDRKNHKSPNAAYPEGAVAGLLGIELGGGNYYHGEFIDKPSIGDNINPIRIENIRDTIKIMYRSELLLIIIYLVLYSII